MVINSLRATARSIIDRRIRSRMCQHHLCALAICSLLFIPPPSTALALSGNSEPAIAANQNGQEIFNVEICRMVGPINPDFEEQMEDQKLMKRLAQPHHKNGVTFDWQLGEGSGVTYWSRKEQKPAVSVLPSKVHHLITLYFPDPDKLVSWTATAIRVSRFRQLVPAGKARVTIMRPSTLMYAAAPAAITLNGQKVADIATGGQAIVDVPAGENVLAASAWSYPGQFSVKLKAVAGQKYALEVTPRSASLGPGALLGPIGGAIDASVNENAGAFELRVVGGRGA